MHIRNALKDIGLSEKEADTYLALLKIGEGNISDIAKTVSIPRTTIYLILKSLQKRGLINFYLKKKRKYFVAENPDKLLYLVKRQEQNLEEIIPQIKAHHYSSVVKPRIKFFEGKEGVKTIFNDILDEKRPFLAITSIDDMETIARDYFEEFVHQRIRQNLKVKLLTNKTEESTRFKAADTKEIRETRFVPKEYAFHTANYIYGNKFAIMLLKDYPVAILIEDEAVAKTAEMQFEIMWKAAPTS